MDEKRLVNVVIPPLEQPFSYNIPKDKEIDIQIGSKVTIPFGKRKVEGFVVSELSGLPDENITFSPEQLKDIDLSRRSYHCFAPFQLKFFQWIADYYSSPLSNVMDVAIPAAAPPKFHRVVSSISRENDPPRGRLQREIMNFLDQQSGPVDYSEILKRYRGAGPAIKRLEEKKYLRIETTELFDHHLTCLEAPSWAKKSVFLDPEQTKALTAISESICQRQFAPYLIHGVTGSGKTEVYIEAIQTALQNGLGALVIVPEIALTPQLIDRFTARLGPNIAILHSGINKRARWDAWRSLLERRCQIAIGARSAVFAPVPNLGLVIVDEEHDNSYKQSDGLRYNARDLAVVLGKLSSCPVVLGSATPSLESFNNAIEKKYRFLSLPGRHSSNSSISVQIIDLNTKKPWEMVSKNISPELHDQLDSVLSRGEQAFILYNRRGFASYLQCDKCKTVLECPNCSVTFTYHQNNHKLQCHYCSLQVVPPLYCTSCSNPEANSENPDGDSTPGRLVQRGAGTEKVFEELQKLFPDYQIDRLDRDTANNATQYKSILNDVRSGKTSILVGTQMIAKGHDLPGVTLVGIVDCDVGLHMPDFRSGERVFQLLTQASGRAGRGDQQGTVVLQTRVPNHPSLQKTVEQDFTGFAKRELQSRKTLNYPPFSKLLRIVASSQDQNLPLEILTSMRKIVEQVASTEKISVHVLGPTTAPLSKLKTEWRWHLLLKSNSSIPLQKITRILQQTKVNRKKIKIIYDLDPQDLL